MENLNLKEHTAIELKYLGNSHSDIAEKIGIPEGTIDEWFRSRGKLFSHFNEYTEEMNAKRQKQAEKEVLLSDRETSILGTNIVRRLAQDIQGKKIPLLNKEGQPIFDKNGDIVMIEKPFKVTVRDFVDIWKQQRIMQGLPINVEKQDITTEVKVNSEEVIANLGLVEEDFKEENYGETLKRITKYLASKGG